MHCKPKAGATLSAFLDGVWDGNTLPVTRLLPKCMTCMGSGTPLNLNDPTCHTSICSCSTAHNYWPKALRSRLMPVDMGRIPCLVYYSAAASGI